MSVYLIGYDLNRPRGADDYPNLIHAIQNVGTWWHCLDSTWLVLTNRTAVQIRDSLMPLVDAGDEVLVARLTGDWASFGFRKPCADWLVSNLA